MGGTQVGTRGGAERVGVATSSAVTGVTTPNDLAIGQYCWRAVYSGDSLYNGSTHTGNVAGECFTTVKQPSTPTTDVEPDGGQRGAGDVGDGHGDDHGRRGAADADGDGDVLPVPAAGEGLRGGRDGRWGPRWCWSNGVATSSAVTGVTTPNDLAIGQYCWRAVYSGDGFYNGSTHTGNVAGECFTTVKQPSTPTTSRARRGQRGAGDVGDGHGDDHGGAGQPTPTGTVTFFLCQPPATAIARRAGTQVGTAVVLSASGWRRRRR